MTKFCSRCERELDFSCFSKAQKRRHGLRAACRECEGILSKARKDAIKEKIYDKLGHVCSRCTFSDKRALQIDHVFGGGNQEHAEIKNPIKFLTKVLEDTEGNYQILCANCNWIKRVEQREHVKPRPYTAEEIEKILTPNPKGVVSEGTRQRLSEAGKGREPWNTGLPAWNRGVPRPPELKEKLSQIATEVQAKKSPEERSRIAKQRDLNMTPEQRSERARKGSATQAAKTPEQKVETSRKSQATKKANREAKLTVQLMDKPVYADCGKDNDASV